MLMLSNIGGGESHPAVVREGDRERGGEREIERERERRERERGREGDRERGGERERHGSTVHIEHHKCS